MRKVKFYFRLKDSILEVSCIPFSYDTEQFLYEYLAQYVKDFYYDKDFFCVFRVNKSILWDVLHTLDDNCKYLTTKKVNYGKR